MIKHFYLFLILFGVLCASSPNSGAAENSTFSIFDATEDLHEDDDIVVNDTPKRQNTGAFLVPRAASETVEEKSSIIKVIDVSFGRSHILNVNLNEAVIFGDVKVRLSRCVREITPSLSPVHKAHIAITENATSEVIFQGWIFSSYRSIAQPVYGNYFFTLQSCQGN